MSFKYALSAGWWSCGHFPQLVKFYSNNTVKSSPINSTRYAKLYPQNGDRIVAIDSVTTFYPMYFKQTCSFHLPVSATRWVLFASTPLTPLLYNHGHHSHQHRYDTIRDAILACARKPTWVGLIYRTESTTKNCKTEKLKSKSRYVRSNSKGLGNHVVSFEQEKERLQWEGFAEKRFYRKGKTNRAVLARRLPSTHSKLC